MMIYGRNPVAEALRGRRARTVELVWATERVAKQPWLADASVCVRSAQQIAELCGTSSHQGVCAKVGAYPYAEQGRLLAERDPLIVVLDEVQDPQNLGSICRSAEAVGATGLVIHERRAAQVSPAVCKASAGAVEHLRIARVRNIADFLHAAKAVGCWCYGATVEREGAVHYAEPDYAGGVVLVLGGEGSGLRNRVAGCCDQLVYLPMRGRIQSLGVSAAAAAILYAILQVRCGT